VAALESGISAHPPVGVVETVPGLRSLMVELDPLRTDPEAVIAALEPLLNAPAPASPRGSRWRIPVCLDAAMAPDLASVATECGLQADEVVDLLVSAELRVAMLGHLPGLPYLTGLDDRLALPRRAEPRERVPAGSLGLAAGLACIYPLAAPGGWHVVGRTPERLFDLRRTDPFLLHPGDLVGFRPIGVKEAAELDAEVVGGRVVAERIPDRR
jgi:KipI family sensor histidine kinase inhibitor